MLAKRSVRAARSLAGIGDQRGQVWRGIRWLLTQLLQRRRFRRFGDPRLRDRQGVPYGSRTLSVARLLDRIPRSAGTRRGARVAELASPESWCTGNGTVGSNPTPSARPGGPLTGPRTGATSHRGFHLWHEAPSADPPALRAGNRKSLRDSRFELSYCERGGVPPLSHFPPVRRAANGVRCHLFLRVWQYACASAKARERRPSGRHSPPKAGGSAYG